MNNRATIQSINLSIYQYYNFLFLISIRVRIILLMFCFYQFLRSEFDMIECVFTSSMPYLPSLGKPLFTWLPSFLHCVTSSLDFMASRPWITSWVHSLPTFLDLNRQLFSFSSSIYISPVDVHHAWINWLFTSKSKMMKVKFAPSLHYSIANSEGTLYSSKSSNQITMLPLA